MRKLLLFTAILITTVAMAKTTPASQLLSRLKKLQKKGIMFAHQDDPVYGTTWKWERGRSDVLEVCGDYPAIMGFDLGKMELHSKENLDGVPFDRMRQEIADQHRRGGISTISWHPWNPATGGNAWDCNGRPVAKILPSGELNATFNAWLDKVVNFLLSLTDDKGKRIPVIFRPWHEMHGGWFWWGCNSCTPEEYIRLFKYTHDYLVGHGIDNAVWCYSPGATPQESEQRFMTWYPGDEYVDVVGVDIYSSDDTQAFISSMKQELEVMAGIAEKHKKLFAVAETGYRNTPKDDWFTASLLPSLLDNPPLYVLLWRNAWDQPEENFGPAPEKSCAEDFRLFHANPKILFVKDIR